MTEPSLGTRALLLIRLGAHCGDMVSVDKLAHSYHLPPERVRAALQALWDEGYVRCELGADGLIHAAQDVTKG